MKSSETGIAAAYADEMRLRIVALLSHARLCVSCLVTVLNAPQPTVSRHLGTLRRTGIVAQEKAGGYTYYRLDFSGPDAGLKRELAATYQHHCAGKEPYRSDERRLRELAAQCALDCQVAPAGDSAMDRR